jgi:uncharacterized ion transporter superfamily protein YfcC
MSIETSKKKKGIQMPHTYIILFLIVLVVCLLTYVIPAVAPCSCGGQL